MIIDTILFYQEYEILEFRLKLLYPYVEKFVIVEADKTFSGLDKPFNYELHKQRYAWAEDKIVYFKLHCDISQLNLIDKPTKFDPNHDCWQIEYQQRKAIIAACKDFDDDDILIMSDADEIVSPEAIKWAIENVRRLPAACQQHFFYYNLKYLREEVWCGSIFSSLRTARSLGTQELRNRRSILTRLGNAGWHLSCFGDAEQITQKIEAFSHQELNVAEFKDASHINSRLSDGRDLFNRDVKVVEVTPNFFPAYFREIVPAHWWPDKPDTQSNNLDVAKKAKVSLTMIVRNEEHNLTNCLESVKGLFDEIVIVDTGSTDRTKEIARKFGARIIDFAWIDDFAAARNVALENATGYYAFWMDADDVITPTERAKLGPLLQSLTTGQKTAYVVRCASGQTVVDHVRLFPLLPSVRWTYRVHEQILPAIQKDNIPVQWSNITILHTGYANPDIKERKRQRDWNILMQELENNPNDAFVLYNLGMIEFERDHWKDALGCFEKSFSNAPHSATLESLQRKLYAMLAWSHQILKNYEESLRLCEEGLAADAQDAELWFRKAVAYKYLRKNIEAEACWKHILRLQRPQKFCSIDQGIYGHLTRRNLAIIAAERGDLAEAKMHWHAVLAECPGDADAVRNLNLS